MGSGFDNGEAGRGGLFGIVDQVHTSFVGKYGMAFSGDLSFGAAHFLTKTGHLGEELAWPEPVPHDTHDGAEALVHEEVG